MDLSSQFFTAIQVVRILLYYLYPALSRLSSPPRMWNFPLYFIPKRERLEPYWAGFYFYI